MAIHHNALLHGPEADVVWHHLVGRMRCSAFRMDTDLDIRELGRVPVDEAHYGCFTTVFPLTVRCGGRPPRPRI